MRTKMVGVAAICSAATVIGILGVVGSRMLTPTTLRTMIDVPEPCIGNTPEEVNAKCGPPVREGTFSFQSRPQVYQEHRFRDYNVRVLFMDGIAHLIIYTKEGPGTPSGYVRLEALTDESEATAKHFAEVNLKGTEVTVDRDEGSHVIYRGDRLGITVMTMPLMSYVVCASTEIGDEMLKAFKDEMAQQSEKH
ncbi:MAG: hypothetical protein JW951_06885 [Lentisphaerae bacterium]|nr:hypothetical protein [Lentisphaerota bacterium]